MSFPKEYFKKKTKNLGKCFSKLFFFDEIKILFKVKIVDRIIIIVLQNIF
mgnify:CR=1 FL=1